MDKSNNDIYAAMHRMFRMMHRNAHHRMRQHGGLYHGQASLLRLIAAHDGASQNELAREMDIRPSSMTELLSKLEQNGLIMRRQDERDQRVMRIYLSEEGKKMAEQLDESENMDDILGILTEEEKVQLLSILEKLCDNLESMEKQYAEPGGDFAGCHRHGHRHRHAGCPGGEQRFRYWDPRQRY
jgi:DNA-binding MarR family transcriptional regulator